MSERFEQGMTTCRFALGGDQAARAAVATTEIGQITMAKAAVFQLTSKLDRQKTTELTKEPNSGAAARRKTAPKDIAWDDASALERFNGCDNV